MNQPSHTLYDTIIIGGVDMVDMPRSWTQERIQAWVNEHHPDATWAYM